MYSTANKMRLSGIVCTIGPVSRYGEIFFETFFVSKLTVQNLLQKSVFFCAFVQVP